MCTKCTLRDFSLDFFLFVFYYKDFSKDSGLVGIELKILPQVIKLNHKRALSILPFSMSKSLL